MYSKVHPSSRKALFELSILNISANFQQKINIRLKDHSVAPEEKHRDCSLTKGMHLQIHAAMGMIKWLPNYQSWALFFQGSLSANFFPWIAHFADLQVLSSLNRSKKNQWFALGKEC